MILNAASSGRLEVLITTYTTYKQNQERINMIEWDAVVADECHTIKERKSDVTEKMGLVNSRVRIGLTGTAIQNNYEVSTLRARLTKRNCGRCWTGLIPATWEV